MGSVAFSDVVLPKSLSMKHEARKVMEMVRFSPKKCGDNTVDLHVWTKVPAGRKRAVNKCYMGLHAYSSLASYRRLEQAKPD